ncbi:MAG: flagellar basal body L-ring protein FlgH [Deltaproteobacteria bacterium]|nr:flagellar basal body L-ring protein FlgH [Deltaproteobacteria bacterium]
MRILVLLICLLLYSCSELEFQRAKDRPYLVDGVFFAKGPKTHEETSPGSLWKEDSYMNNFFTDQRAKAVGDIITVRIVEVSQASEKASTDTTRSSSISAGIPNLLGLEVNPQARIFSNPGKLISANTQNEFAGEGETRRTGSLSATITAKVIEVLPNGNLVIEGKREIFINAEKKEIKLQGIVRPKDIAADNSILSTQIADAKIIYSGLGVISEKLRPGWAARLFDVIWPF